MKKEYPDSYTWKVKNFKYAKKFYTNFFITNKKYKYYFYFDPNAQTEHLAHSVAIHIHMAVPYEPNANFLNVLLWRILLINDKGEECHSSEMHTCFRAFLHTAVTCGVYSVDRDFIQDPLSGLLSDGNLTIKCTITELEDRKLPKAKQIEKISDVKALQDYESLLENSKFSDVVFMVRGQDFKLHKNILSARSPVFAAMFESDLEESKQNRVEIIDVDVEVFGQMLRFIYGANVELIDKYAEDLLVASDKYQLESLKQACVESLVSNLTIESVAKVITLADMHNVVELKLRCKEFVTHKNATKVTATEGWKLMAKSRVELLMEMYEDILMKYENNNK